MHGLPHTESDIQMDGKQKYFFLFSKPFTFNMLRKSTAKIPSIKCVEQNSVSGIETRPINLDHVTNWAKSSKVLK